MFPIRALPARMLRMLSQASGRPEKSCQKSLAMQALGWGGQIKRNQETTKINRNGLKRDVNIDRSSAPGGACDRRTAREGADAGLRLGARMDRTHPHRLFRFDWVSPQSEILKTLAVLFRLGFLRQWM